MDSTTNSENDIPQTPADKTLNNNQQRDNSSFKRYNNQRPNNYSNNYNNRRPFGNTNNYNNNNNYRNNNNNNYNNRNNGRGGAKVNAATRQQRHQDRARATLAETLVECSLPSISLTADGKVFKQTLTEGTGEVPSPTSVVYLNYVCRLDSGCILDAFVDPQLPTTVKLNKATLTPAFETCLLGMKEGEKCLLTTSYEYGYGELGCPTRIPPKANLQYEIELFHFHQDFSLLDDGTFAGKLAVAEQAKISGNHFYKLKMHRAAVRSYKSGDNKLQLLECANEDEQKQVDEMVVLLNLNLAASALQTKLFDFAMTNCDKVLTLDPNNIKGLFRLARAYAGQYDFKSAKGTLMKAIKLKPNDLSLREEYESLVKKESNSVEGNFRGAFQRNDLELFTEAEMEEMKKDRIALGNARMFM